MLEPAVDDALPATGFAVIFAGFVGCVFLAFLGLDILRQAESHF